MGKQADGSSFAKRSAVAICAGDRQNAAFMGLKVTGGVHKNVENKKKQLRPCLNKNNYCVTNNRLGQ